MSFPIERVEYISDAGPHEICKETSHVRHYKFEVELPKCGLKVKILPLYTNDQNEKKCYSLKI